MKFTDVDDSKDKTNKFYGINSSMWKNFYSGNFFHSSPTNIKIIENGYFLPLKDSSIVNHLLGGIVDSEGKYICGHLRHTVNIDYPPECSNSYPFDKKAVKTSHETVIYGGLVFPHFGFMLIESLSRLWYVINNSSILEKHKIVFLGKYNKLFVNDFLKLIGISSDKVLFLTEVTKFDKIIIPEQSGFTLQYAHNEYLIPYDKMVFNSQLNKNLIKHPKIYLSKSNYKINSSHNTFNSGYRIIGEEYFENFYSKNGYNILHTSNLSMEEKVFYISNADEIVTTSGTMSHYFLFAKKNCRVVTLVRNNDERMYAQALINSIKHLNFYMIDCSLNFLYSESYGGCSLLYPTQAWRDYVKDNFKNVEIEPYDSEYILEYIKYFYQFYKCKRKFDFSKEIFINDFFKRCGQLFFNEEFSPNEQP